MPPTSKSPQNSASVADSTCLAAYESIATSCGRNATGTFDPNFCTESGGGGTMGWNNDGTVISGSPRYIMKTLNSDECSQFQSYENLATSTIQWNNSWVPLDAQIILDTTSDPVPVPALPELQTQGCTDDVCYNGNPAYFAVCEGQPSRQNPHTMRHRVVFNGWTSTSGEELLSALRLRCDQDILDWQAWNNGTAWLAEFGLYSDDKGSSCDCIPPAIFDASVGINVNPAGCCEANISPGPLFATM
ncbi:hypothetical protein MMC06_002728 [Schaereria dolodes]|nr:hypothetical protein [Schaereria dolodes]